MEIVNLNRVRKINLVKRRKTDDYVWRKISWLEKFINLFTKNKLKEQYIRSVPFGNETYNSAEDFNKECGDMYWCYPLNKQIWKKAHVNIWYDHNNWETRYFDSDKEAKEFFNKLRIYAKQNNIPFIDFYSDL